jgi:hypothetical protein
MARSEITIRTRLKVSLYAKAAFSRSKCGFRTFAHPEQGPGAPESPLRGAFAASFSRLPGETKVNQSKPILIVVRYVLVAYYPRVSAAICVLNTLLSELWVVSFEFRGAAAICRCAFAIV